MKRRTFLRYATAAAGAVLLPRPQVALAGTADFWTRDRTLWLRRKKTNEEFFVVFWAGGEIDVNNYIRLCYILRDVNESQTVQMDINLLNLMYGLQHWGQLLTGKDIPLVLHSGYRTLRTNAITEGAKPGSEHPHGRAGDYTMPGFSNTDLANMTTFFRMGGVGLYPTHVHGDTGARRHWVVPPTPKQLRSAA